MPKTSPHHSSSPRQAGRETGRIDDPHFTRGAKKSERFGEQTPAQQRDSEQRADAPRLGGQDSRDQSPNTPANAAENAGSSDEEDEADERDGYASDTRENLSRRYAEALRRKE